MKKLTTIVHQDKGGKYLIYCTANNQNHVVGSLDLQGINESYTCLFKKSKTECNKTCSHYHKLYIY